jgi:hypothetical protein
MPVLCHISVRPQNLGDRLQKTHEASNCNDLCGYTAFGKDPGVFLGLPDHGDLLRTNDDKTITFFLSGFNNPLLFAP